MSGLTDTEDFPYCVFCEKKLYIVALEKDVLTYMCYSCGGTMEVSLADDNGDEKLL